MTLLNPHDVEPPGPTPTTRCRPRKTMSAQALFPSTYFATTHASATIWLCPFDPIPESWRQPQRNGTHEEQKIKLREAAERRTARQRAVADTISQQRALGTRLIILCPTSEGLMRDLARILQKTLNVQIIECAALDNTENYSWQAVCRQLTQPATEYVIFAHPLVMRQLMRSSHTAGLEPLRFEQFRTAGNLTRADIRL